MVERPRNYHILTTDKQKTQFPSKIKCKKIFLPILVCVFDVITNEITVVERPRNYNILTTDKETDKTNRQTYRQTNRQTQKKVSNISHSASR